MSLAPQRLEKMFAVIARFDVRDGDIDTFLKLAHDDAFHSTKNEKGCLQFDVSVSADNPLVVTFYEVYESRSAFNAHLETAHVNRFRAGFPLLITREHPVTFLECSQYRKAGIDDIQ